jgi:hypothetical protein
MYINEYSIMIYEKITIGDIEAGFKSKINKMDKIIEIVASNKKGGAKISDITFINSGTYIVYLEIDIQDNNDIHLWCSCNKNRKILINKCNRVEIDINKAGNYHIGFFIGKSNMGLGKFTIKNIYIVKYPDNIKNNRQDDLLCLYNKYDQLKMYFEAIKNFQG